MTIIYQKKLRAHRKHYQGCTEEAILQLEARIGRRFPQAYREFLFLAGEDFFFGHGTLSEFEELEYIQQQCRRYLEEEHVSIERDFWITDTLDCEQWSFFYFDDGEDPPVYNFGSGAPDEMHPDGIVPIYRSFSKRINDLIPTRVETLLSVLIERIVPLFRRR